MRVLLVVGDLLTRHGLAALLTHEPTVEVIGIAGTVDAGRVLLREREPDVVIVDAHVPPLVHAGAPLLLQEARGQGARTMIVTDTVDAALADIMLADDAGGWAWLVRDRLLDGERLISAITRVGLGGTVIDDAVLEALATHQRQRRRTPG